MTSWGNIYGSPAYSMGDYEDGHGAIVSAAANAPVTRTQAVAAQAELGKMKGALARWLKYRSINDTKPADPRRWSAADQQGAALRRAVGESELAGMLHRLLAEVFDAAALPSPDVTKNPLAAVALAQIAISGKLPGDRAVPEATGMAPWVWPAVIIVGAIAFVITSQIRSSAEREAEREKYECIKAGKCTDTGFWLKAGAALFIGWFLWEKAGIGKRVMGRGKGGD